MAIENLSYNATEHSDLCPLLMVVRASFTKAMVRIIVRKHKQLLLILPSTGFTHMK